MATWKLTTQYKKSAVERSFWYKDGQKIVREEGYRWGTFHCQSDEQPDIDLKNPDGYEVSGEYDWELGSLDDGCWADWEFPDDMSEEDQQKIEAAWDENWYEGMEELGWSNDDTEYWFHGPLCLENEDTGETFEGEPSNPVQQLDPEASIPLQAVVELQEQEPLLTEWFSADVEPVRQGSYQIKDSKLPGWPFPTYATWDGQKWSDDSITQWRGLAENPDK